MTCIITIYWILWIIGVHLIADNHPCIDHMNSPPHTWFPLQQVLCLDGSDLRHSGEDVGAVGGCALYAVAVVDLSITCFLIHIELNGTEIRETFTLVKVNLLSLLIIYTSESLL